MEREREGGLGGGGGDLREDVGDDGLVLDGVEAAGGVDASAADAQELQGALQELHLQDVVLQRVRVRPFPDATPPSQRVTPEPQTRNPNPQTVYSEP